MPAASRACAVGESINWISRAHLATKLTAPGLAHRMIAHVSDLLSVCSRTAFSTACLTGGGTSFGSSAHKICGCACRGDWISDAVAGAWGEGARWAHVWLFG